MNNDVIFMRKDLDNEQSKASRKELIHEINNSNMSVVVVCKINSNDKSLDVLMNVECHKSLINNMLISIIESCKQAIISNNDKKNMECQET